MSNDLPRKVTETLNAQNKRTVYIVLSPTGDDNTFKFNSDDYDSETKELANAMAVGTIEESTSEYKVATGPTNISLKRENGYPVGISDDAPGGDGNAFLQRETVGLGTKGGRSYFIDISNSGFLSIDVIKGKSDAPNSRTKDYDELLTEVNRDNNSATTLGGSVATTQFRKNTYYQDNKFLPDDVVEKDSNVGRNAVQLKLGSYTKVSNQQSTGNVNAEGNFQLTQDILKSLGSQVTLKASGEYYVPKTMSSQEEILLAQAAALAPSLARLGLPVPFKAMKAGNVLAEVNPEYPDASLPSLIEEDGKLSFGSTNNWLVLFDGFQTQFTLPAIAIQLGAVASIIAGAAQLYDAQNANLIRAGFLEYFDIEYTGDPENSAVFAAAIAEAAALGASAAVPGVSFFVKTRLAEGTGWYTVTLRKIIRLITANTYGTVTGITNVSNTTTNNITSNFDINNANIIGSFGSVVNLANNGINAFGLGRLLGIFKVLGTTAKRTYGDYSGLPVASRGLNNDSRSFKPQIKSYIDSINDNSDGDVEKINIQALIKKDRLRNLYGLTTVKHKNPLAWGASTTPSQYLLPSNIKIAGGALNAVDANTTLNQLNSLGSTEKREIIENNDGRIKQTLVHELETQLEASYMPFYFHDLRTNEIVSFHAFLESSKDGFQAEWNSIPYYGRVEPIHIYKGTTRDISVSFFCVSTNEEDHDNMWWKINKLVTMVYPQYTKGRNITTADGKTFVQPFSQLPGSSPIIRMRLGDVWKSNYSKFNAARLFGLSDSDFNIDPENRARTNTNTYQSISNGTQIRAFQSDLESRLQKADFRVDDEFLLQYVPGADAFLGSDISYVFGTSQPNSSLTIGPISFGPDSGTEISREASSENLRLYCLRNLSAGTYRLVVKKVNKNVEGTDLYVEYKVEILDASARVPEANDLIIRFRNSRYTDRQEIERIRTRDVVAIGDEPLRIYDSVQPNIQLNVPYVTRKVNEKIDELLSNEGVNTTQRKEELAEKSNLLKRFFNAAGNNPNPIMQSFESTSGKGLAVAFKTLDIDWSGAPWETSWNASRPNSRAPQWVKLTMNGTVIHDITPGIDYNGFNRAPVYQVGTYSNALNTIDIADRTDTDSTSAQVESERADSIDTTQTSRTGIGE